MRARRPLTVLALLLVLGVLVYAAWTLVRVHGDLLAAQTAATQLERALDEERAEQAAIELAGLQEHAGSAADRTDGPLFEVLSWLPVVGDDADGVRRVSGALSGLAEGGLPPLVSTVEDISAGSFLPRKGRVPVDRVAALEQPVTTASASFAAASQRLAGGDSEGYVGALATAYDDLRAVVDDGAAALGAAETATRLLPAMLGSEGERRYVAIFQNNAELRTTGGLPGAAALLTADKGRLSLGRQTGSLPQLPEPVLPLSRAERELYDQMLGTHYQDANFIPHFPRTAELVAAHWERQFSERVDGVVSFDPIALSYLLKGTGPVEVAGVKLTSRNAVDVLLHDTYQRLEPEAQDAFFAAVARTIFDKLAAGQGNPRAVLEALARGTREQRLLVTSFDKGEQAELGGHPIAGEVAGADDGPQLGVYLQDATESKLTYLLDYEVTGLRVTSCSEGVQTLTGRLELRSRVPAGGEGLSPSVLGNSGEMGRPGDQFVQIELHAPQGGKIKQIRADGKKRPVWPTALRGHQVAQTFLVVEAKGKHEVAFTMTAPAAASEIDVRVTPGVEREDESSVLQAGC